MILGAKACAQATVIVSEALALKECIKAAIFLGCRRLVIEGDNLCVINCLRGTSPIPWKIANIMKDISESLTFFLDYTVNHQNRQANCVADYLANIGHSCPTLTRWFESFSPKLFG